MNCLITRRGYKMVGTPQQRTLPNIHNKDDKWEIGCLFQHFLCLFVQGGVYLPPGQGVSAEAGQHSGGGPGLCPALHSAHSAHSAQPGQPRHWASHRGQGEIVVIIIRNIPPHLITVTCDISAHFGSSLPLIHHIYIVYLFIKRILTPAQRASIAQWANLYKPEEQFENIS